jgi:hypothetical protein
MNSTDRHLTPDEIVERVFPGDDRPSAVPAHLAACAECQARVARLREAWLLDRGAVAGVVDALPETFWETQRGTILRTLEGDAAPATAAGGGLRPFPASVKRGPLLRHPVLALGSLAAALTLVAGISFTRLYAPRPTGEVPQAVHTPVLSGSPPSDQSDDELLLSIERVLREDPACTSLVSDEPT